MIITEVVKMRESNTFTDTNNTMHGTMFGVIFVCDANGRGPFNLTNYGENKRRKYGSLAHLYSVPMFIMISFSFSNKLSNHFVFILHWNSHWYSWSSDQFTLRIAKDVSFVLICMLFGWIGWTMIWRHFWYERVCIGCTLLYTALAGVCSIMIGRQRFGFHIVCM